MIVGWLKFTYAAMMAMFVAMLWQWAEAVSILVQFPLITETMTGHITLIVITVVTLFVGWGCVFCAQSIEPLLEREAARAQEIV